MKYDWGTTTWVVMADYLLRCRGFGAGREVIMAVYDVNPRPSAAVVTPRCPVLVVKEPRGDREWLANLPPEGEGRTRVRRWERDVGGGLVPI